MGFIPDRIALEETETPYFESSKQEKIPGRETTKSVQVLQRECMALLAKLGASSIQFVPGRYPGKKARHGYQVLFWYGAIQGRIDIAALPLRSETPKKKDRALAQALYLLRNELEALVFSTIHHPGSLPLVPYLMNPQGQTVTEYLIQTQGLPQLTGGAL